MGAPQADPEKRRKLLAKVHIAAKELGLTEEQYRDGLRLNFGVESAGDMSIKQLERLLDFYKEKGWKQKPGRGSARQQREHIPDKHGKPRRPALDKQGLLKKIEALLADKGRREQKEIPWSYASAILEKQSGIKRLEWATPEQLRKVVAALMYDAKRKGYDRG